MIRPFAVLCMMGLAQTASAAEYEMKFSAYVARAQAEIGYSAAVALAEPVGNRLSGEIKEWHVEGGARPYCHWHGIPVEGFVTERGEVSWKTSAEPRKGCGVLRFVGRRDGQNIVGRFPVFEGREVVATMTRR